MELNYYLSNLKNNEVALILNSNYNKIDVITDDVKNYLLSISNENRINKVLKMLGLEKSVLNKNKKDLSNLEESLVLIAYQLLQRDYLVIYYLDTFLNKKEKIYLRRLLNKISHEYNIKTLVFTNDIEFCFHLIDKIFIIKDKQTDEILDNNFYNEEIYSYITMPDIISFVLSSQKSGHNLDDYLDFDELLKGIIRQ